MLSDVIEVESPKVVCSLVINLRLQKCLL